MLTSCHTILNAAVSIIHFCGTIKCNIQLKDYSYLMHVIKASLQLSIDLLQSIQL